MANLIFFCFYWIFEIFAITLHCFVTSFIILQRYQKNKTYTSPFYLLYILNSFADMGNLINSNFLNRFTYFEVLHPWLRSHTLYVTICYLISGYCLFSQAFYHASIGINRIWVSYFLLKAGRTVLGRLGNYFIWFLPLLPIIFLCPFFFGTMIYLEARPGEAPFAIYSEAWIRNYNSVIGPTIIVSSSILSFILTLLTIRRYRNLLKQSSSDNNNGKMIKREIYLLGHATVTLFFEILVGCYFGALIISTTYDMPYLFAFVAPIIDYVIDLSSLVNPVALLIICKFVRDDFKDFVFRLFGKINNKVIDISGNHS